MSNVTAFPERDATADVIAANVRAEIARMGLSDAQFAAQFGLTPMSASRRLSGQTPFTTSEVQRASKMFGVSIESLFTEHRTPRPGGGAGRRSIYLLDGYGVGPAGIEPTTSTVQSRRFTPAPIVSLADRRVARTA